jgi:cell division transport system permease protein
MANLVGKKTPKKSKPTYITSILMVSLILLMLGIVGIIALNINTLTRLIKENVRISLYLSDAMNEVEIFQMQKKIETKPYVKFTEYISKEQAKKDFLAMSGEEDDFDDMLGFNPLPSTVHIYLQAGYANKDSIQSIREEIQSKYGKSIRDLKVNMEIVKSINSNIKMITIVLSAISILLVVIAVLMIDSTVRLSMYSNRFLIKSMQLVGADRKFVTRPYMGRAVVNGFLSSIIAIVILSLLVLFAQREFSDLRVLQNMMLTGVLFVALVLLGVLISWFSTYRAVLKYLKLKLEELY